MREKHRTLRQRLMMSLVLVLLASRGARADQGAGYDPSGGGGGVTASQTFAGSATTSFAIQVPPFYGLEPRLALRYDSQARNGWLGVGWALSGVEVIERSISQGDSHFLLWGERLYPCATATSPGLSCKYPMGAGGTHYTTRVENGLRIWRESSEQWRVQQKSGVEQLYTRAAPGVEKWVLRSVSDARGNVVTYTWATEWNGKLFVRPTEVSWAGGRIRVVLTWADRSDREVRALPGGLFEEVGQRLSLISVRTRLENGTEAVTREFELNYSTSAATGVSLLRSVRQRGYEGTTLVRLPPTSFAYEDGTPTLTKKGTVDGPAAFNPGGSDYLVGDFGGDGRADVLLVDRSASRAWLWNGIRDPAHATGLAYAGEPTITGLSTENVFVGRTERGTFAGGELETWNGRSSVVWVDNTRICNFVLSSDGTTLQRTCTRAYESSVDAGRSVAVGDVDGDGFSDVLTVVKDPTYSATKLAVYPSTRPTAADPRAIYGPARTQAPVGWAGCSAGSELCSDHEMGSLMGDFNGDGKLDVAQIQAQYWLHDRQPNMWGIPTALSGRICLFLANEAGTAQPFTNAICPSAYDFDLTNWVSGAMRFLTADVNGDGRTDVLRVTSGAVEAWLSSGTANWSRVATVTPGLEALEAKILTPDLTGDGRADLIVTRHVNGTNQTSVLFSTATGNYQWAPAGYATPLNGWPSTFIDMKTGDFDGRGTDNVLVTWASGGFPRLQLQSSEAARGNLLSEITHVLGGRLVLGYRPSTRYTHHNSPPLRFVLTSVQQFDGRNDTEVPDLEKTFDYAGGLHDYGEGRFHGFETVRTFGRTPASGVAPVLEEKTYDLRPGYERQIRMSKTYDRSGVLVGSTASDVVMDRLAYPYRTLQVSTSRVLHASTGATETTTTTTTFNADGNPTEEVTVYGDASLAADARTTRVVTSHAWPVSTSGYWPRLVFVPRWVQTFDGAGVERDRVVSGYDGEPMTAPDTLGSGAVLSPSGRALRTGQAAYAGNGQWVVLRSEYEPVAPFRRVRAFDALGMPTTYAYETHLGLYPWRVTNALGHATTSVYDYRCHTESLVTDPNGARLRKGFDAFCRPVSERREFNTVRGGVTVAEVAETRTDYLDSGNPALQRVVSTRLGPDARSGEVSARYLDGLGRAYQTVAYGASTGAAGAVLRQWSWDEHGRLVAVSQGYLSGGPVHWERTSYDARDRVVEQRLADGTSTFKYYDDARFGRVITTVDAVLSVRRERLNGRGWVIGRGEAETAVSTPASAASLADTSFRWISNGYDSVGRLRTMTDPKGRVTSMSYNFLGQLISKSDPDLGTSTMEYDKAGQEIRRVSPPLAGTSAPVVVRHSYDELGRLVATAANRSEVSSVSVRYTATAPAQLCLWLYATGGERCVGLSAGNNLTATLLHGSEGLFIGGALTLRASGASVSLLSATVDGAYVAVNDSRAVLVSGGTATPSPSGGLAPGSVLHVALPGATVGLFDGGGALGRPTGSIDESGFTQLTYDQAGRVLRRTLVHGGRSYTTTHEYDAWGRALSTVFPDGDRLTPTYDTRGRLTRVADDGESDLISSISYDPRTDQPTSLSFPNGARTDYTYHATRGWMSSARTTLQAGAYVVHELDMGAVLGLRDAKGRLRQVHVPALRSTPGVTSPDLPAETWEYAYDALSRLTLSRGPLGGPFQETISYDIDGNITSATTPAGTMTYSYGGPQPHAATNGGAYVYDARGNMITREGAPLIWDAFDRLVEVVGPNGSTQYMYDSSGRRVRTTRPNGTSTLYVTDDYEVEFNAQGTPQSTRKTFRLGARPIAQKVSAAGQAAGTKLWLHTDHLYTVRAETDESGSVRRQRYTPWGQKHGGDTLTSTLGYTAERSDDGTGLLYLHARWYDPKLRRFISADPTIPSRRIIGLNHYAYAFNDPINLHDKNGLQAQDPNPNPLTQTAQDLLGAGADLADVVGLLWKELEPGASRFGTGATVLSAGIGMVDSLQRQDAGAFMDNLSDIGLSVPNPKVMLVAGAWKLLRAADSAFDPEAGRQNALESQGRAGPATYPGGYVALWRQSVAPVSTRGVGDYEPYELRDMPGTFTGGRHVGTYFVTETRGATSWAEAGVAFNTGDLADREVYAARSSGSSMWISKITYNDEWEPSTEGIYNYTCAGGCTHEQVQQAALAAARETLDSWQRQGYYTPEPAP